MSQIKSNRAGILKRLLFGALALISIVLTAQYFVQYVSFPLMDRIHPIIATVAVITLGLLAADVGALLWRSVLHNNCRSAAQVNIAYIMIAVTLTMATVTTMMGIADAFNGAELVPATWHQWIGWLIVLVIAIEFLGGAFLFSFFDPEQTIAREIMAAVVDDADQTVLALRAKMGEGRDRRVAALSDQLSTQANQLIYNSLAANSRTAQQRPATLPAHSNASIDDSIIDGEAHTWVGDSGVPAPVVNEGQRANGFHGGES